MDLHRSPIPCRLFRLFAFRSLSYPLCLAPSSPARQQGQHFRDSSLSHFALSDPHPAPFPPHPIPSLPAPLPAPSASSHPIPLLFSTILSFFCRENVKIDGSGQAEHAKEAAGVTKASSSRQNTRSQRVPEGRNRSGTIPTCPEPLILTFWT